MLPLEDKLRLSLLHGVGISLSTDEAATVARRLHVLRLIARGHRLATGLAKQAPEAAKLEWKL